jgi:hypothetical protein
MSMLAEMWIEKKEVRSRYSRARHTMTLSSSQRYVKQFLEVQVDSGLVLRGNGWGRNAIGVNA